MLLNWDEVKIREAKIIFRGVCVAAQHVRFISEKDGFTYSTIS
jgi:hypothetical protein